MIEGQAASDDQRRGESLRQEKRAFVWACIWMSLAAIALGGFFFVVHWEKQQLSELLLAASPDDDRTMGRVVVLLRNSECWRAAFFFPWLFFTIAFALSLASWLLSIRKRRMQG